MGIIYCVINKVNGKIYIGKTEQSLAKRRMNHYNVAFQKSNRSYTSYFHSAIRKYGKEKFFWREVDNSENPSILVNLEKQYIEMFGSSFREIGYNLTEGGEGIKGYKFTELQKQKMREAKIGYRHSEETKTKISVSNRGKKHLYSTKGRIVTEETRAKIREKLTNKPKTNNWKKVICIETGKVFDSVDKAASFYDRSSSSLSGCLHGASNTFMGFHWKFYDEEEGINELQAFLLTKGIEESQKRKKMGGKRRAVACIETQQQFSSIKEAAEFVNVDAGGIADCCKGKSKTSAGYHWRFVG